MPFSSSSFTSVASVNRGGGCVNFCSGRSVLSSSLSPSASGGSTPDGALVVVLVLLRLGLVLGRRLHAVGGLPARELRHRALDAEQVARPRLGDVDRRLVEGRRRHLRGHEPVPDEAVNRVLLRGQKRPDLFRVVLHRRGPDGFVRVLRIGLGLEDVRLFGHVLRPECLADVRPHRGQRIVRHAGRIGTHISNEADRALRRPGPEARCPRRAAGRSASCASPGSARSAAACW